MRYFANVFFGRYDNRRSAAPSGMINQEFQADAGGSQPVKESEILKKFEDKVYKIGTASDSLILKAIDIKGDVAGDSPLELDFMFQAKAKVMNYPNLQFIRRSTSTLGTGEAAAEVVSTLTWNNGAYEASGNIPTNDVNYTILSTGNHQDVDEERIWSWLQEQQENPKFSYFFDQYRIAGWDSYVRIHNLYKLSHNVASIDTLFHNSKRVEKYYPADKSSNIVKSYTTFEDGSWIPSDNNGDTIVIDVSDQFNRLAYAALPAVGVAGYLLGSKFAGGDDIEVSISEDLFVYDETKEYIKSFDGQVVGIIDKTNNDKGLPPTSAYYYGTDIRISTKSLLDGKEGGEYYIKVFKSNEKQITPIVINSEESVTKKYKGNQSAFALADILSDSCKPLPVGKYMVQLTDAVSVVNSATLYIDILPVAAGFDIVDTTSKTSDTNKNLISDNLGVISNIKGAKYSKYRYGSEISMRAGFDMHVAEKLKRDDIEQSWIISFHSPSDVLYINPLWKSSELTFNNEGKLPLVDIIKDGKFFLFSAGDYVVRAYGSVKYGKTYTDHPQALLGFSIMPEMSGNYSKTLFITDKTSSYVNSVDEKKIGIITPTINDNEEPPVSSYYYATPIQINVEFKADSGIAPHDYNIIVHKKVNSSWKEITEQSAKTKKYSDKVDLALSDIVSSEYKNLGVGEYLVQAVDTEDSKNVANFYLNIYPVSVKFDISDSTSTTSDVNKPLLDSTRGVISNIKGAKYSKYMYGSQLSILSAFDRDISKELSNDKVKQSWNIGFYKSDDESFSNALWQSESLTFTEDGKCSAVDMTDGSDFILFEPGDYIAMAKGEVKYGDDYSEPYDAMMAFTIIPAEVYLSIEDVTKEADSPDSGKGYFQPIYSEGKQIAGQIKSDDKSFKGSIYYIEDLDNIAIYLKFTDASEHEFKKVLVNIATGSLKSLPSGDTFDSDKGAYLLNLKNDIEPGTYKLSCIDSADESKHDDILLTLMNKAVINMTVSSNDIANNAYLSVSCVSFSVNFIYISTLSAAVNIVGYLKYIREDDSIIASYDMFDSLSSESLASSTGKSFSNSDISNCNIWSIHPNISISNINASVSNDIKSAKYVEICIYDADNSSINFIKRFIVANNTENNENPQSSVRSRRSSTKIK